MPGIILLFFLTAIGWYSTRIWVIPIFTPIPTYSILILYLNWWKKYPVKGNITLIYDNLCTRNYNSCILYGTKHIITNWDRGGNIKTRGKITWHKNFAVAFEKYQRKKVIVGDLKNPEFLLTLRLEKICFIFNFWQSVGGGYCRNFWMVALQRTSPLGKVQKVVNWERIQYTG